MPVCRVNKHVVRNCGLVVVVTSCIALVASVYSLEHTYRCIRHYMAVRRSLLAALSETATTKVSVLHAVYRVTTRSGKPGNVREFGTVREMSGTGPSTQGGNKADCLIVEPGGE